MDKSFLNWLTRTFISAALALNAWNYYSCFFIFSSLCSCQLLAFGTLLNLFVLFYYLCSISLSSPLMLVCRIGCHLLQGACSLWFTECDHVSKNSRNASCPLPIFQGPVYARMLFLHVSTFNNPQYTHMFLLFICNTLSLLNTKAGVGSGCIQHRSIICKMGGVRKWKKWKRLWDLLKPVDFCKQKPF